MDKPPELMSSALSISRPKKDFDESKGGRQINESNDEKHIRFRTDKIVVSL
jgi:hypothetical protein